MFAGYNYICLCILYWSCIKLLTNSIFFFLCNSVGARKVNDLCIGFQAYYDAGNQEKSGFLLFHTINTITNVNK